MRCQQIVVEIQQEIDAAFAARPYPGDDFVAIQRPDDPSYEGHEVARFFRGKDWRDFTWESAMACSELDRNAFMFFLTPQGFAYYLPGFLKESLDLDVALDLASSLCFALDPPGEWATKEVLEHFSAKVSQLSSPETRAVKHALEFLAAEWERRELSDNPPLTALAALWDRIGDTNGGDTPPGEPS